MKQAHRWFVRKQANKATAPLTSKIALYFYTLRHLKAKQLIFRLWYKFYRPVIRIKQPTRPVSRNTRLIETEFLLKPVKNLSENTITFLHHTVDIRAGIPWNDSRQEKLWLYNLHYFDGLCAAEPEQRGRHLALLEQWVEENPPFGGNAWEPYPLSLRIVNSIKFSLLENKTLSDKISQSLYLQAKVLKKKCEYHILGNHLFENYKALCFAGLYFDTSEARAWFQKGCQGLHKEIKVQILKDGGHFERSPMYHSLILEGLLDLYLLFQRYDKSKSFLWKESVQKMLYWLEVMKRNAKEISYFNDAANGIAQTPDALYNYAQNLGFALPVMEKGLRNMENSGYIAVRTEDVKLILDTAEIGPKYLPGHAHADTLSFELMIEGYPVFVNLGTSCYGISRRRQFERGTAAHNTLMLAQTDSSEMWAGFRVARRAKVTGITIEQKDGHYCVHAAHDGYRRLKKTAIHSRTWVLHARTLDIEDRSDAALEGCSHLHVHPNCECIQIEAQTAQIRMPNGRIVYIHSENPFDGVTSYYAEEFGRLKATKTIKIQLPDNKSTSRVRITW